MLLRRLDPKISELIEDATPFIFAVDFNFFFKFKQLLLLLSIHLSLNGHFLGFSVNKRHKVLAFFDERQMLKHKFE